jgi:hypothetical protein
MINQYQLKHVFLSWYRTHLTEMQSISLEKSHCDNLRQILSSTKAIFC